MATSRLRSVTRFAINRVPLVLALVVSLAVLPRAHATAQEPDRILIRGKQYPLTTNPLEPYLEKRKDSLPKSCSMSTARWRGYVAGWKIAKRRLFLTAVYTMVRNKRPTSGQNCTDENVLAAVFPRQKAVVADWYSGTLIVPSGPMKDYVHMGYASTYERYFLFTVRQGIVEKELRLSYEEFLEYRRKQFAAFKETTEFKLAREELIKSQEAENARIRAADTKEGGKVEADAFFSMDEEQLEQFMFEFFTERYLSMDLAEAK